MSTESPADDEIWERGSNSTNGSTQTAEGHAIEPMDRNRKQRKAGGYEAIVTQSFEDPEIYRRETFFQKVKRRLDPRKRNQEFAYNARYKVIKKLPKRSRRWWAWEYEILRPWEPQPAKNYYKLLHQENPWMNKPPSGWTIIVMLIIFLIFNYCVGFLPFIINISTFEHRLTVIKSPDWLFPLWFNIFCCAFAHTASGVSIWFLYLTGGFMKHYKKMIPYFLMLACEAIWPDAIFSWRVTALSVILIFFSMLLCLLTIVLFWKQIEYSGALLFFMLALYGYEAALMVHVWILNGATY